MVVVRRNKRATSPWQAASPSKAFSSMTSMTVAARPWLPLFVVTATLMVLFLFSGEGDDTASLRKSSWQSGTMSRLAVAQPKVSFAAEDATTDASQAYVQSFGEELVERQLTFFHIPKTAGTAIESAAGEHHVSWGSCLFPHRPKRDICTYPEGKDWPKYVGWWHLPRSLFPLAGTDPYMNRELFGVIRDPYDRMVSEFYYICTLKVFSWRPDQCDRSRLFEADYMNEWLGNKLQDRDRGTAEAYLRDNGHFTPQYEYVVGPNEVRMLDYVLTMEESNGVSLAEQFGKLMRAFKLSRIQLKKQNALGAAARDSQTHLNVSHLDGNTVSGIHRMYPEDFPLGGYIQRDS